MADFRKLFLALAVLTLVFTTVASAQSAAYHCDASAGSPLVRAEGITEYVGDIVLNCSGTVPAGGIQANIRVQLLNTNQTSIVVGGSLLESVLILDELTNSRPYRGYYAGSFPDARQNLFQGLKISETEVEFDGVVLAASGSSGAGVGVQQMRIKNIRANASALGAGGTIFAVVNITGFSGTTAVAVNNALLRVADIRQGLVFYTKTSDNPNKTQAFVNCQQPGSKAKLNFQEGFASAFRIRYNSSADHGSPDGFYGDESGFDPGTPATGTTLTVGDLPIGKATQGTRLLARFTGVPSGVVMTVDAVITVSPDLVLHFYSGANSDFSGGTERTSGTRNPTTNVLYEVVTADPTSLATLETVVVPVTVQYGADTDHLAVPGPATATVTAKGSFAPLSTTFTTKKTGDAPAPRFIDTGVDRPWWSITPCRTILLFPFVTNQAGFDTGLVLANTSADPLGTTTQAGACTLSYYGTTGATGAAPAAQTTASIPAGSQAVGTLSSGGSLSFPATPAFQGYIFAICNFQYAHGFAFVSDLGSQKLAMGYLPLVVPDKSNGREPSDNSWDSSLNDGEQLNN